MTEPLAIVCYQALMPGTQLVNRLQDLGYRVLSHGNTDTLAAQAKDSKPLLIIVDLAGSGDIAAALTQLKQAPETQHIPVLAFAAETLVERRAAAHAAGATLVASDTAVGAHLPQLLEQLWELES